MGRKLALLLLFVACLGCSRYPSHLPAAEQIEVILFEDLASLLFAGKTESGKDDHRMFLSIGDPRSDVPAPVLAHIAKSYQSARAYHLATPASNGFSGGVLEKETTKRGSILWIESFVVNDDGPLIIRARRFTDGLDGEVFEYRVERIDGQWRIVARKTLSVS